MMEAGQPITAKRLAVLILIAVVLSVSLGGLCVFARNSEK
jgi:hypothetical protein